MPLQELNEPQLIELSQADIGKAAILFTTPMCGTCKIAERMLEITEVAGVSYPIFKTNINFTPRLREQWRISSVPCLIVLRNGKVINQENAIHSVDYLYKLLKE
ncbi:thioredoxin family protein [Paenibacillus sp. L3-i20]|uniref:thioredoxin family protein n=1 Tax=Paenibacillus sp. L3-i20 TaxID=2905833 RepID=UPI001EDFF8B6|nr:thioredoxin family protein [Paenibacillus sp. L3-i20]GKU80461.1 thiol reductase thioredoxin [Paenibacillus sp. L3-i20]